SRGTGTLAIPALEMPGSYCAFEVRTEFLNRYQPQRVGAGVHRELWIPAEERAEFNRNIVGLIEVVAEFRGTAAGIGLRPGTSTPTEVPGRASKSNRVVAPEGLRRAPLLPGGGDRGRGVRRDVRRRRPERGVVEAPAVGHQAVGRLVRPHRPA